MLGVHRLTTKGAEYYLADLAQELPLPRTREEGGLAAWSGRAAEGLGLRGAIDPEQLRAVLGGRHPTSGPSAAIGASHRSRVRPDLQRAEVGQRGVRARWRGGGSPGRGARTARACRAPCYLESHALSARRGSGEQREIVPTTGLVAASFTHGVNRNLDPHLHTHVVMANLVHGLDGQWGTCDHRGLSAHRAAAAAVYEAHLRVELSRRLGVRWVDAPGLRAEVDGVSPLLRGEFSSRSADIRRHMAEQGAHSARGARVAWAATRPEKRAGLDFGELSSQWERRARSFGTPRAEMAAVFGRRPARAPGRAVDEHRFGAVLSLAPDGAARRRDVVAAFATAAVDGADERGLDQLDAALDAGVVRSRPGRCGRGPSHIAQSWSRARICSPRSGHDRVNPVDHEVWRDAARPSTATAGVGG